MTAPTARPDTDPGREQTLYDQAGSREGVDALAAAFYRRVLADDLLLPLFRDPTEDHAGRLALWLGEVLGGPRLHSATRGGLPRMAAAHQGLRIREEQRARWVEHMTAAAGEVGLAPGVRAALLEYAAWGSQLARSTSQVPGGHR